MGAKEDFNLKVSMEIINYFLKLFNKECNTIEFVEILNDIMKIMQKGYKKLKTDELLNVITTNNLKLELRSLDKLKNNITQIEWLGTQKELAELFLILNSKNWIILKSKNNMRELAKILYLHFNYPTYSKSFNSIYQILKPQQLRGIYENNYPQIYTKKYKSKFDLIKENKQSV